MDRWVVGGQMDGWINEWKNGCRGVWIHGYADGRINEKWVYVLMYGAKGGRMRGSMWSCRTQL